ncbi:hypothetical protein EDB81DRAFT_702821 [Dactylonectria macrodidyma]|uniref:Rhodopsin domain-containing protein n=1 Tax=Dactylonectria macrodidyma TaxID=307937 RepID=A0A9P9D706_9HYPO|nr:hypothetical protein EDB81DRAFT_702821 [Dactylonectria macrodidyma]
MRNPPAPIIASWPAPNYENPVSRGPTLLIVELTIGSIAIATFLARLYVRVVKIKKMGFDDWLMLAAMVFGIGVTVCVILAAQLYGWNVHIWDLRIHQAVKGRQVSIAAQTLFLLASGLAKDSILASYLRIAPKGSWLHRMAYVSIIIITSLMAIFLIILWTQCNPMKSYWTLSGHKDCSAEGPPVLSHAVTTAATDLLVCALPLPTLLRLKLPVSQRILLVVLFSLGLLVVFAASIRAYWSHYVTDETYDVTWEGFYLWVWTAVEANLGVICGSIPSLRPLFKTIFRSKSSGYYNTSTSFRSRTAAQTANNEHRSGMNRVDALKGGSREPHAQGDYVDIECGTFEARPGKGYNSLDKSWRTELCPDADIVMATTSRN